MYVYREIYDKALAHTISEAEKSQDCIWQAGDPGVNVLVESEGRKTDVPAQGHQAGGVPCHLGKHHPFCSTQAFNLKYFCLKTPAGIHPE